MRNFGFIERWISRVMRCVTTVTYFTLVNGQPSLVITPTRGLRQGDFISSYLYLLCVEGLSKLLHEAKNAKLIRVVRVARGCHSISHLFFASDSLVFCRVNITEWVALQSLLDLYEKALSQGINKQKMIFFSANTKSTLRNHLLNLAGISL